MSDILRNLRSMQGIYEKSPTSFPSTARLYKEAADEIERLSKQLVNKTEHLNWIKGYAKLMTPDNWRDMQLRIERQATTALTEGAI